VLRASTSCLSMRRWRSSASNWRRCAAAMASASISCCNWRRRNVVRGSSTSAAGLGAGLGAAPPLRPATAATVTRWRRDSAVILTRDDCSRAIASDERRNTPNLQYKSMQGRPDTGRKEGKKIRLFSALHS
jgi:hypothetical protein